MKSASHYLLISTFLCYLIPNTVCDFCDKLNLTRLLNSSNDQIHSAINGSDHIMLASAIDDGNKFKKSTWCIKCTDDSDELLNRPFSIVGYQHSNSVKNRRDIILFLSDTNNGSVQLFSQYIQPTVCKERACHKLFIQCIETYLITSNGKKLKKVQTQANDDS